MEKETDTSSSESGSNSGDGIKGMYDLLSEKVSISTETTLESTANPDDISNEAPAEQKDLLKVPALERIGPTGEDFGQEEIIAYIPRPSKEKRREKSPNPKSESKFFGTLVNKLKSISPMKEDRQHILEQESSDDSNDSPQSSYSQAKSESATENMSSTPIGRKSRTKSSYVLHPKRKTKAGLEKYVNLTKVAADLHSKRGLPETSAADNISQSTSSTKGNAKIIKGSPSKKTCSTTSNPLETTTSTVNPSEWSISQTFDFKKVATSPTHCRPKRSRPFETYSSLKSFQLPPFKSTELSKASTSKPSQRTRSKSEEFPKIKDLKSLIQKCHKAVSPKKEKQETSPKMKPTILETTEFKSDISLRPMTDSEQEARKLYAFRKSPTKSKRSASLDVPGRIKLSSITEMTHPQALLKETTAEIQSQCKLKEKSQREKDISQAGPSSESLQTEDSELLLENEETFRGETAESVVVDETKRKQGTPLRRARKDDEKDESPRKRPNTSDF